MFTANMTGNTVLLGITGIATTYLTGTLTNLMVLLWGRSRRLRKPFWQTALRATVWIVYIVGAVVAALDLPGNLVLTLVLPVALVTIVTLLAAVFFRPR